MLELLPDFENEAPLDAAVVKEAVYYLTRTGTFKLPITPPPLRDHGNYVISINRFVKWLGSKVEEAGITVFTGFAGSELLIRRGPRSRRPHRRQGRRQERRAEVELRARLRPEGQGGDSRGRQPRFADQAADRALSARPRTQSADLRRRREGAVGTAAGTNRRGRSHLHHGLSADLQRVRRRLDLWLEGQSGVARIRDRTGLSPIRASIRSTFCRNSRSILSSRSCSKAARWSATARSRCRTEAGGAFRRSPAMAG